MRRDVPRWRRCAGYLSLGLVLLLGSPVLGERVVYVNSQAVGAKDGMSWLDAYTDLQDALDDARINGGCPCDIWIAAGLYKPDRGTGDPALAFEPPGGLSLYGGFAGWEECLGERNWDKNETILSGDLIGGDDPNATGQSNCCEVTLQPGCEDAECAAIVYTRRPQCAQSWDLTCALMARDWCCETCRTTFCGNSDYVLRLITEQESVTLDGLFVRAAGVYGLFSDHSNIAVSQCTFTRNAYVALFTHFGSASVLRSRFVENGLPGIGGAGANNDYNQALFSDCEFVRNHGPGLVTKSSAPIRRCSFRENGTALAVFEGFPTISDCLFLGNQAGAILTAYLTGVRIERCVFLGNHAAGDGGAINNSGSMTISQSLLVGNSAGNDGAISSDGALRLENSSVVGNWAGGVIGGIGYSGSLQLINSIVWGNYDRYFDQSGFYELSQLVGVGAPAIRYSIIHGWTGRYGGVGNSGVDPMFVDPLGTDGIVGTEDDDLHLLSGSPAINAGDPNTTGLPTTDLDGHARVLCDRVDIGAYEFGIGDYDCDQSVDLFDFSAWSSCMTAPGATSIPVGCEPFDFNADSAIDLLDFAALQSTFLPPGL